MSMMVLNRTQAMLLLSWFLSSLESRWLDSRLILSKLSFRDREMWNLTNATLTLSESFRSSDVSGEKFISSGLMLRPPPYGWNT